MPKTVIMVFTKAPIPGAVKTRLIPALGETPATHLHRALVEHTLNMLGSMASVEIQLHCAPNDTHPFLRHCAGQFPITLHCQKGDNLGHRLFHAFARATDGSAPVIAIGTDCPDLNSQHLRAAIDALSDGSDAVLGPAADGGYYLIGLRQAAWELFDDIQWGTEHVAIQTRQRLQRLGWRWVELTALRDMDTAADLAHFRHFLRTSLGFTPPDRTSSSDAA